MISLLDNKEGAQELKLNIYHVIFHARKLHDICSTLNLGHPPFKQRHYKTISLKLVIARDHTFIGQFFSGTIPYWSANIMNSTLIGGSFKQHTIS